MSDALAFENYVASLRPLVGHVDPLARSAESDALLDAARSLAELPQIEPGVLSDWIRENPDGVPALGLTVGLSQERLKNILKCYRPRSLSV